MSELDYQRGLRGGNCINYDGQHYTDWFAGYQEYERKQKDRDFREELEMDKYYSPEEQTERHKIRQAEREREIAEIHRHYEERKISDKEDAYKRADENKSIGLNLLLSSFAFFSILIGGYILQWVLHLFKIHLPSIVIWGLAILPVIIIFWESNKNYKKDIEEVNRRYGKRD